MRAWTRPWATMNAACSVGYRFQTKSDLRGSGIGNYSSSSPPSVMY